MDDEQRRKYNKEYYVRNKEYIKEHHKRNKEKALKRKRERRANDPEFRERSKKHDRDYREKHREEIKKRNARLHVETPWIFHYYAARNRCNNPNNESYKYYGNKGIRMLLSKLEIEILYKRDYADQMKRPSIDRINPKGDYIFGNCRFVEHSENIRRNNQMRGKL